MGGCYYPTGQGYNLFQNQPHKNQPCWGTWNHMEQPRIPFLDTLNLLDLLNLINDVVSHDPMWPVVPTKIPSDIWKFEGKNGEDLGKHVTTSQLWFSSNSLNHDYVHLRVFQCTLTALAEKWYIELPGPEPIKILMN